MFDRQSVTLILPALNEAEAIGKVLADVPDWVDDIVVVDNGSTDGTGDVATGAGARVVREPRRGYGRACLAGLAAAGPCDIVVFLDADYSDHPDEMDRLVAPIARGQADMVIGSRTLGRHERGSFTLPQRFGNALACRLMNLLWRTRHTDLGPFRAIRRTALRSLRMRDETYGWTVEMQIKAARAGLRVREAPVSYRPRIGISKISGTVRGVVGAGWKILSTLARYAVSPAPVRTARDRLIVFSRYPLPGRAKTRLIPALGPLGAAGLQRAMTRETINTARQARAETGTDVEVRYAGGEWRKMRRWLGPGVRFAPQGAGDLGQRMRRAFEDAFGAGCRRAVVVGTDCPELTEKDIADALAALDEKDLVLGPSTDGGYWLLGLRRPADVFEGIEWSTESVTERTLALAEREGLSVHRLTEHTDVDTPDELHRLHGRVARGPVLSVIIPALNEAEYIEAAVASARCEGVEVLVVDGGSTDDTVELAQRAGATVMRSPHGRAKQMNAGAAAAAGQTLLFLHADTGLPDGFAGAVFDALSDPRVVAGAFTYQTDLDRPTMRVLEHLARFRSKHLHLPYGDQGLFVRRDIFESLGGFPDLPLAEDLHFVRRLRSVGRIASLPLVAVTSARRSRKLGVLKTTAINQLVVAGCFLCVSPDTLAAMSQRLKDRGD